jgi:hypothetical protein
MVYPDDKGLRNTKLDSEITQLDTCKDFVNYIFIFYFCVKGSEKIFLVGNLYVLRLKYNLEAKKTQSTRY